ncbi:hypothetical protein [Lentzea sp. NPDC092896]
MRIFTRLGITLLAIAALATTTASVASATTDFTVTNTYYVDGNQ